MIQYASVVTRLSVGPRCVRTWSVVCVVAHARHHDAGDFDGRIALPKEAQRSKLEGEKLNCVCER